MILMVAIYFVHNRGGFDPLVYDERFDPATASSSVAEVKVDPIAQGKRLYTQVCAACHQANGAGIPGAFPALSGSALVAGPKAGHIDRVFNGKTGTAMAAFGKQLSDLDLAAVLTYERNSWNNKTGDAVQPAEIAALRH